MKRVLGLFLIGFLTLWGCQKMESSEKKVNFYHPLAILKCQRSIKPEERVVLDKQMIPEKIAITFEELMKAGRKTRLAFVCCEYYLQNHDGETIGILTDNEKKMVQGFDVGRHADAIKLHTEAIHDVLLLNKERTKREAFSLLVGLFQKNNNNPRDDVPNTE